MAYLVLYFPCLLLAICSIAFKREALIFGLGSLFIATAFAGLRGGGTDYDEYMLILKNVQHGANLGWIDQARLGKDFLFGLLAAGIFSVGADVQAVFFAAAALALTMKAFIFQKLYINIAIPLFIYLLTYYILHEFIQIRAALAISSCFIAAYYLLNKRPFLWLLFSVLGIGWHISAFAFLIFSFPFFFSGRVRNSLVLVMLAAPFISAFYVMSLPDYFLQRAEYIAKGFTLAVLLHYATEIIAFSFIFFSPSSKTSSESVVQKKLAYFSFYLMTVGFCMYAAFNPVSGLIAYRYMEFFDTFSIFLYAYIFFNTETKLNSLASVIRSVTLLLCLSYQLVYMVNAGLYADYISYL